MSETVHVHKYVARAPICLGFIVYNHLLDPIILFGKGGLKFKKGISGHHS